MDALKLVPQLFFDAIGRVVPGAVAFVLWILGDPDASWRWKTFLQNAQGLDSKAAPSALLVASTLLLGSYVVGHLISPLTKAIQRLGERITEWERKRKIEKEKRSAKKENRVYTPPPDGGGPSRSQMYEWLRTHAPEAGAHCAKLRAEFTMYNSLSAVFLLAIFGHWYLTPVAQASALTLLTIAALGMAERGRDGVKTFEDAVKHFYAAATERPIKRHESLRAKQLGRSKNEA